MVKVFVALYSPYKESYQENLGDKSNYNMTIKQLAQKLFHYMRRLSGLEEINWWMPWRALVLMEGGI